MSAPLRDPVVRRLVAAQTVSFCGSWMQRTAQSWMVLHVPGGGAAAMGVVLGLQYLPLLLFGLWTGALCDQYPKHRVLTWARGITALLGMGLAACAAHGAGALVVYGFALVQGFVTAVERPANESLLGEIVEARLLHGTLALNGATFNVGRLTGPALAGVSLAQVGVPSTMLVSSALLLVALPMLPRARRRSARDSGVTEESASAGAVLRRVRCDSGLTGVLVLVALVTAFGLNFPITCAAMADGVFHRSATSFGAGLTALAVGALGGAFLSARLGRPRDGRRVAGAAAVFGALEAVCALAPTFAVFVLALVVLGVSMAHFTASARSYVQHRVDDDIRGRVMGLYQMAAVGTTPLAAPLVGWISDALSPRAGLLVGGLVPVLCAAALAPRLDRATVSAGAG
ncbi:MFS transporter [Streptomyces roseirectus]|uniref:MFS transporter n=1 Tax=Streptomyces roseirectus TaxID=2768066 RepID=A0A7H0I7U5_9ACTN|nr:MFS transporter [Streptomyces roseirectus]QNP68861.1 MFS transporter [Streptomyces roseirectus]